MHSPALAAISGNVLHTEELFHLCDPCTQGAWSNTATPGAAQRSVHLAEGTCGSFPSHAQMLSGLALQDFNTTDLIIIYLLHQKHK